ncbi:MAG TPA: hypothetical protein VK504_19505 [Vicinamibacterales bacterium]|nr:hypothetical protein [Vicinamibacterales bacterium]
MKRNAAVARVKQTDAGAERINKLEEELALAPMSSRHRRALTTAIRIEARRYRGALDREQATATHDARPEPTAALGSLNRRRGRSSSHR